MSEQGDAPYVKTSLDRVQRWVEEHAYKGYEPFDGLSSWVRPLTGGNLFAERLLMQLVRQSPINLRPLLGIKPKESTKGRGYMAWGYLILYRATGQTSYLEKARQCLAWLDKNKATKFKNHAWANHFDFAGRGGSYTSQDPIIVWSSLIGQAYLEAFEITHEVWYLGIAVSVCGWIMDLPRERTPSGDCLSYLAHRQSSIHNANMLGAAMLARAAKHTGNRGYLEVARAAMLYSCSRQLANGSWFYAEDPIYHWIDNFHTGYNLDSLKIYIESTGDQSFRPHLDLGLRFFKQHFIEEDGRPKYYHSRAYPIDSQAAAQCIDTLSCLVDNDPECLELALKVARWTIHQMQEEDGHFQYRQYPWGKARTAMLHWGQATTFKALAVLYLKLREQGANTNQKRDVQVGKEGVPVTKNG